MMLKKAEDPVKEGGDGEEEPLDPSTRELEVKRESYFERKQGDDRLTTSEGRRAAG